MSAKGTFLAFDYGERRIGIAVGQSVTGTASPLSIVRVRDGEPDWVSIDGIVAAWQPSGLVVGEPLHMDGRTQPMTRRARRFRHALRSRFGLPVHAADERLTTVEARAELAERGAFRGSGARRRHEVDHPVAARIILESWLARQSHPLSAADTDPCAVTGRTPSSRFDAGSATPSAPFGPCSPPPRRLGALATKVGEIAGLGERPPDGSLRKAGGGASAGPPAASGPSPGPGPVPDRVPDLAPAPVPAQTSAAKGG